MMRAAFDALGPHAAGVVAAALHRDAAKDAPPAPTRRFRAIFISDIHLGTAGCQAHALLDFLRDHSCDTLYLVGDIIDGWALRLA